MGAIMCNEDRRLKILGLGSQGLNQVQKASKGLIVWLKVQKVWEAQSVDAKGKATVPSFL